jgi:MFS family permease
VRESIDLLRSQPSARVYFAVLAQSGLGTGAGYVALLLIAYERFNSAWAISLVLLADLVPAMLLGPVFGAAADRWSRRRCMIAADVVRAAAFLGIALVDGFVATFALALLAGVGTGLFTPAALASLPSLVEQRRVPAATALYGAIGDVGFIAGPALAAAVLLFTGSEAIVVTNAVTFTISAAALARLRFGGAPAREPAEGAPPGLIRDAREGLRTLAGMAGTRAIIAGSGAMLLFAGLFNVAELPFATDVLGADEAGFAVLAAVYGLGFVGGSLSGSAGGDAKRLKRRFLTGLALVGAGFLSCGAAPSFAAAFPAFALAGVGNGLVLVYERLLIQRTVPDRLTARVFGVKDGVTAWAFAIAFIAAGGLVEAMGARWLLVWAGVGGLLVWLGSAIALRGAFEPRVEPEPATARARPRRLSRRFQAAADRPAGQHGPDLVGSADRRPGVLNDGGDG